MGPRVRRDATARGPGFESHRRGFESWASSLPHFALYNKSLGMLLSSSLSEKDGSRSQTKGGKRYSNVKAFLRWLLVSFL